MTPPPRLTFRTRREARAYAATMAGWIRAVLRAYAPGDPMANAAGMVWVIRCRRAVPYAPEDQWVRDDHKVR